MTLPPLAPAPARPLEDYATGYWLPGATMYVTADWRCDGYACPWLSKAPGARAVQRAGIVRLGAVEMEYPIRVSLN